MLVYCWSGLGVIFFSIKGHCPPPRPHSWSQTTLKGCVNDFKGLILPRTTANAEKSLIWNKDCVLCGQLVDLRPRCWLKGQQRLREQMRRRGEKVWFHMQVAVKDVYLARLVSLLSRIRNEQKFSSVHSDRLPDIKWRPCLSKQARCYYVYLWLHMGFHSCFYWDWGNSLASRTWTKYFYNRRLWHYSQAPESKNKTFFPDV